MNRTAIHRDGCGIDGQSTKRRRIAHGAVQHQSPPRARDIDCQIVWRAIAVQGTTQCDHRRGVGGQQRDIPSQSHSTCVSLIACGAHIGTQVGGAADIQDIDAADVATYHVIAGHAQAEACSSQGRTRCGDQVARRDVGMASQCQCTCISLVATGVDGAAIQGNVASGHVHLAQ